MLIRIPLRNIEDLSLFWSKESNDHPFFSLSRFADRARIMASSYSGGKGHAFLNENVSREAQSRLTGHSHNNTSSLNSSENEAEISVIHEK